MSQLVKTDPFEEMRMLKKQFFGDNMLAPAVMNGAPTTDVYTEDGKMIIETYLPKFKECDVDVCVDRGNLVISGEKHEQEKDKKKQYVVRESSDSFYRSISLPERADKEHIEADLTDGVLKIYVPLLENSEPKKISMRPKETEVAQ